MTIIIFTISTANNVHAIAVTEKQKIKRDSFLDLFFAVGVVLNIFRKPTILFKTKKEIHR